MQETISVFNKTLQKTHIWLKELAEIPEIGDMNNAYQVLKSVLHALRDQLPVNETAHFSAQLPMLIRGFFYEGWNPNNKPKPCRNIDEFNRAVDQLLNKERIVIVPNVAIRAVFDLLNTHIAFGELEHLLSVMPKKLLEELY